MMTHRLGVGRVRHLEVKVLWLQQMVYKGLLTMRWQAGKDNNSDLGTKVLAKSRFQELVISCGLRMMEEKVNQVKALHSLTITAAQAGQLLSAVTLLTLLAGVTGVGGSGETGDSYSLVYFLFGAAYLLRMMSAWIWAWCRSKNEKVVSIDELRIYEAPISKVLHLDLGCQHLKKSRGVTAKLVCKTCSTQYKLKTD